MTGHYRTRLVGALALSILFLTSALLAQTDAAPLLVRTTFETPTAIFHYALTIGPEGNLWYTGSDIIGASGGSVLSLEIIGRLTPSGEATEITFPPTAVLYPTLTSAAGKIWSSGAYAAPPGGGEVARPFIQSISPTSTPALDLSIPETAEAMTTGSDGNIWYLSLSSVGSVTPFGSVTRYPCVASADPTRCRGTITAGLSDDIWFTYKESPRIGRVSSAGQVTTFDLPGWFAPYGIALGPDGAMWFTDLLKASIGRITAAGRLDEFPIPSGARGTNVVTRATDDSLWFASSSGLGRIVLRGDSPPEIQEFPTVEAAGPIAAAPDGTIWVAEGKRFVHISTVSCPNDNLCLQGRFRVRVIWRSTEGTPSAGKPVGRNTNHGYFWFFSPGNVEVAVKIVDGRAFNGHFWIFGASLTNVEYDLEVTDTVSGSTWTHHNLRGEQASFADTSAF